MPRVDGALIHPSTVSVFRAVLLAAGAAKDGARLPDRKRDMQMASNMGEKFRWYLNDVEESWSIDRM